MRVTVFPDEKPWAKWARRFVAEVVSRLGRPRILMNLTCTQPAAGLGSPRGQQSCVETLLDLVAQPCCDSRLWDGSRRTASLLLSGIHSLHYPTLLRLHLWENLRLRKDDSKLHGDDTVNQLEVEIVAEDLERNAQIPAPIQPCTSMP